jgi:hypothetical protein
MGAVCTEEQNIVFIYTRCSHSVVVGVSEGFPKNVEGGAVVTTNRSVKVHKSHWHAASCAAEIKFGDFATIRTRLKLEQWQ